MKPVQIIRINIAIVLFFVATALISPQSAWATHFRYGHYFWISVGGTTIEFTIQNGFRRSFTPFIAYECLDPATLGVISCSEVGWPPGHRGYLP